MSQVAAGLRWLEVQPTYIFSSPLVRAMETADIFQASMSIPSAIKRVDELLPDANPERSASAVSRSSAGMLACYAWATNLILAWPPA